MQYLPDPQCQAMLDAMEALDAVASTEQLAACLDREVHRLFPHGALACDLGKGSSRQTLGLQTVFAHRLQDDELPDDLRAALVERWLATRRPVLVESEPGDDDLSARLLDGLRPFKFDNLALHVACDIAGGGIAAFWFINCRGPLHRRHEWLLRLLVPHLRAAVERALRAVGGAIVQLPPRLSAQQQELLRWIQMGKTNEEVALILGMTHSNVKYHVRQILKRLGVTNRAQAACRFQELKWTASASGVHHA